MMLNYQYWVRSTSGSYRAEDEESMRTNLCIYVATVLAFGGALLPAHGATAIEAFCGSCGHKLR